MHLSSAGHLGFTLIELMFTLLIAAIFAALAAPSFTQFIAAQRVKTAAYDLSSALTGARSEAMKRNLNVALLPTNGDWKNGWTMTAAGVTLAQHEAVVNLEISGPTPSLTYNSSGRLAAAVTPFSVTSNAAGNSATRCITVDLSGLPRGKTGPCP